MAVITPTLIQGAEIVNGGALKATPANVRFDIALVTPHILAAELGHVMPVLGEAFYKSLKTAKGVTIGNHNPATGPLVPAFTNGALETLWREYLQDLCAWATIYEALPFVAIQIGSNGVHLPNSEHASGGGIEVTKFLQDQMRRRIQTAQDRLSKHLCDKDTAYPDLDKKAIGCAEECPCECDVQKTGNTLGRFGLLYVTKNSAKK